MQLTEITEKEINIENGKYFFNPNQFKIKVDRATDQHNEQVYVYTLDEKGKETQAFVLNTFYSSHQFDLFVQNGPNIAIKSKYNNIFEYHKNNNQVNWTATISELTIDQLNEKKEQLIKQKSGNLEKQSYEAIYGEPNIITQECGDYLCYFNKAKSIVQIAKTDNKFVIIDEFKFPFQIITNAIMDINGHIIITCKYDENLHDAVFFDCMQRNYLDLFLRLKSWNVLYPNRNQINDNSQKKQRRNARQNNEFDSYEFRIKDIKDIINAYQYHNDLSIIAQEYYKVCQNNLKRPQIIKKFFEYVRNEDTIYEYNEYDMLNNNLNEEEEETDFLFDKGKLKTLRKIS